ncbi:MAG: nuclear transport factor 2 family protein [Sphingomonadales bacterium]|nr:nuclear transport factor 2 family protein [Sphingomonadales bacterium]
MRSSTRLAALVTGALASIALAVPAIAQDDVKAQFQARYTALRTAMEAHDTTTIGKIFAPGYQMTDLRGESHSGSELVERLSKMAARPANPSRHAETKVLSATVSGDSATVQQQLVAGGTRAGDDGKEHTMEMVSEATDTWTKAGVDWQLSRSVQTSMTVKRDGEVFFHEGK